MKILVMVLLLAASIDVAVAQNLDNYHPRGTNPDAYSTNRDGSFPRIGGAQPGTAKAEENRRKNRWDLPAAPAFDPNVTLSSMLAPGNDLHRFRGGRAARITGYVASCVPGGSERRNPPAHSGESCNNGATDPLDTDSHIDLVISPTDQSIKTRHIIVEVSPRIRELMRRRGLNWTTRALNARLTHHWVEFEGWLFFDPDHKNEAKNTDPQDAHGRPNWRASAWEIHPVTSFRVLNGRPADLQNVQPLRRRNPRR